jgi:hypothetical protein
MAKFLRYNTASQEILIGYMVDSTDGNTEETGLTIANTDIMLYKEGATSLVNKNSGGATHISNGLYYAVLDATDTNTLGNLNVLVHVSGALAWKDSFIVLPQVVYDSLVAGSDTLQVDLTQIGGSAVSTSSAQLGVNLVNISGSPVSATSAQIGTNLVNIAGSAVSTSTAQLGVNLVNIAGSAVNTATAQIGANIVSTAANAITGTSLDATAGAEIADAVWDEAASGHVSAGTFGIYNAATQGANVTQWNGSNVSAPSVSGVPKVDVSHMGGSTLSTSTAQIGVNTVSVATDAITNTALNSNAVTEIVAGLLAGVVEGAYTVNDVLKLMASIAAGKASGLDSNAPVYRNLGDTLNRISATTDASGNRTAVTLNLA